MSGRPIRFLGGVIALWTMGRIAFLLPSETPSEMVGILPVAAAATVAKPPTPTPAPPIATQPVVRAAYIPVRHRISAMPATPSPFVVPPPIATFPEAAAESDPSSPSLPTPPALPALPVAPDRWSASLWAIARQGGGALLPGGQLGGTQAGVRLLRRIDRHGALSASLRVSTPWQGIGREVAAGLDWKPLRKLPVRLLVEQRLALDAGPGGTAMLAVSGIGPRAIAPGLTLTAYAQGGAVARGRIEPFADGAIRASTPLTTGIDLGLGLWGGAQRGVQRLDVGPTLGIAVPMADRRIRLSLDWRQRVAGQAAPGSGPALTLAGDF